MLLDLRSISRVSINRFHSLEFHRLLSFSLRFKNRSRKSDVFYVCKMRVKSYSFSLSLSRCVFFQRYHPSFKWNFFLIVVVVGGVVFSKTIQKIAIVVLIITLRYWNSHKISALVSNFSTIATNRRSRQQSKTSLLLFSCFSSLFVSLVGWMTFRLCSSS